MEFHASLGRRRRAAAEARANRFPDRMAAVAAARKVVRWRDELPAAIDDDIVLGRELDRICPDIIHVHDVFMMGVAARAAGRAALKGRKVHLVYDAREYLPGLACVPERLIAAYCDLESEFLPDFDRVITVSEPLADLLVQDHGLLRRPDLVLNAPVVDQEADDVPQLREVVGLAEGIPLLVYGGGVNSARGVQTVIEALVHLPGVHFVLVVRAPNSVTMHLEALAEELGVADRFHQAGFVPPGQVTQYFASADIGVSPLLHFVNHDVALTNKFCEYLLAGLPIITSDTPAQADLVTELGLGQSSAVGIGGDPINGLKHVDVLKMFNDDPDTDAVIMIGEIGGPDEVNAAQWAKDNMKKPVVGFIAGVTAPPGKRMGHAGALISGGADTADAKLEVMEACGIRTTRNPSEMGKLLKTVL